VAEIEDIEDLKLKKGKKRKINVMSNEFEKDNYKLKFIIKLMASFYYN